MKLPKHRRDEAALNSRLIRRPIKRMVWLFLLPTFAAFCIGFLYPFFKGLFLSFCNFRITSQWTWTGLENYRKAFQDPGYMHAFWYTALFALVSLIVINLFAFTIAYALTQKFKGTNVFRTVFFLPNLIGMLSFMLGLVVTGLSVAREREAGTFDQLLVSPATPTEIALAKLIPGCVVGLAHGTIFLLVSVFGFGVPFTGSVVLLYVAVFIFSLAAGGIGLMISSLSSTQQQAFLGAFTVGVPCILLSGAVTPVINMPVVLQHGSQLNPIRHFTTLVQGVFLRDITFEAASVSLLKICAITVVCVCVAVWMFRRRV